MRSTFWKTLILPWVVFVPQKYSWAEEPIKHVCKLENSNFEVRIVGGIGDLLEIHDLLNGTHYANYDGTRSEMGGRSGELDCSDVFSTKHMIAIRTGWKNDLLQIYGIPKLKINNQKNYKGTIFKYNYFPRDYSIDVTTDENANYMGGSGEAILTRNGKSNDVRVSFCWDSVGSRFVASTGNSAYFRSGKHPFCNTHVPAHEQVRLDIPSKIKTVKPLKPKKRRGLVVSKKPLRFFSANKRHCISPIHGFTGSVEFMGTSDSSCAKARTDAIKRSQGRCKDLGSTYKFLRNERLKTPTCR